MLVLLRSAVETIVKSQVEFENLKEPPNPPPQPPSPPRWAATQVRVCVDTSA